MTELVTLHYGNNWSLETTQKPMKRGLINLTMTYHAEEGKKDLHKQTDME